MNTTITQYGAIGTGTDLNTYAIQQAIDAVHAAGGGTVTVPPGVFLTGMIYLRDRVRLHLDAGAVLKASPRVEDHPKRDLPDGMEWNWGWASKGRFHLVAAVGCRDIAITGQGTIDGNGPAFYHPSTDELAWPKAYEAPLRMCTMVQIERCQGVRIEGVTLTNVSFWTLHLHESDRIVVDGIRILNPHNAPNGDGIDITGCRGVMISNCHIDTCDDAICLKTFPTGRSCENVVVTNCVIRTDCVGLKLGCVESFQDIRQVTFSNCVVRGSHRAIGLYCWRGQTFENIAFSNITCDSRVPLMYTRLIHIEAQSVDVDGRPSTIRNVRISNFIAQTNGRILLAAAPGSTVENIQLRDVLLDYVTVDDPALMAATVGGSQFAKFSPWARTTRAALVADNIRALVVDGFQVRWPSKPCPESWRFARKAANGTDQQYQPADWGEGTTPPFGAVAVRNVQGGYLHAPGLQARGADTVASKTGDCDWQ
jgi:polygalacturonase